MSYEQLATKSRKDLCGDLEKLGTEGLAIKAKVDDQSATPNDVKRLNEIDEHMGKIEEALAPYAKAADIAARVANTRSMMKTEISPPAGGDGAAVLDGLTARAFAKSIGQQFVGSDAYKAWKHAQFPNGQIPERLTVACPVVPVETKSIYTSAIDQAAGRPLLGQAYREPGVVSLGWTETVMRSLCSVIPISTDTVEVVREKSRTSGAAIVAEATSASGNSGTKPEGALDWETFSAVVKTIAEWIPATTRVLADAPRLAAEIDNFLRADIERVFENQILNGDGTGSNFLGLNNTVGILAQAWAGDLFATLRKAATNLRINGRAKASGFLLSPADIEAIDLLKDDNGRYYFGGPTALTTGPTIWGIPVKESEYQAEGVGLLGDFRQAVIYDREQTSITVGTINDDFIRNIVRILGEMRAAFFVRRPKSFVQIDLTA